MSGIPWTRLLGKLGLEATGYQETLADCRANPWIKPKGKAAPSRSKPAKKPKYPSAKHGAD